MAGDPFIDFHFSALVLASFEISCWSKTFNFGKVAIRKFE